MEVGAPKIDMFEQSLLEYTAVNVERHAAFALDHGSTRYTYPYGEMMDFYIHSMISQKTRHLVKI